MVEMLLFAAGGQRRLAGLLLAILAGLTPSAAYSQTAAKPVAAPAPLRLEGLVAPPRTLTTADLAALPHLEQATTDKDGKKHVYRGVALREMLHLAGAPAGKAIHGAVLAETVLATAADGYQAVFALPEIDADFVPQTILLAASRQPLPPTTAPTSSSCRWRKSPPAGCASSRA